MPYKDKQKKREYQRKYAREYYHKNKERVLLQGKIWRENNPDKIKEIQRKNNYKQCRKERICVECGKITIGTKKKKYCDECRKKVFQGNQYWKLVQDRPKGDKVWNWKGGITYWKKRIWDSPKYREWRKKVFERDNYTCQECGAKNGEGKTVYLEAHHLKSFTELLREHNISNRDEADRCKKLWNIKLGITLCNKCHNKNKHGRPKKTK